MNETEAAEKASNPKQDSFRTGALFGIAAAFLYTLANIGLRDLSTKVDFVLVAAAKGFFTAIVTWPWLMLIYYRRRFQLPRAGVILVMIAAAVQVQLFGGVLIQRAFGTIGLALVVPIYIGSMVVWTAILGKIFLGEKVNWHLVVALAVLILSVFVLSLGANQAHANLQTTENVIMKGSTMVEGILAASMVGLSYAILGITIRWLLKSNDIPEQTPVVVVSTVGAIGLGMWSITRGGLETLTTTEPANIGAMVFAGLCNAIAFVCLSRALKILPAVYVIGINASQAAIAGVLGVLLFSEPSSLALTLGLITMLVGFVLLGWHSKRNQHQTT